MNQPFRNHTTPSSFVCLKKIVLEPFFGAPANSGDSGDFGASGDARAGIFREFPKSLEDFPDFPEIPEASEGFSGIFKGFPLPGDCPGRDFPLKFIDFGRTAGETNGFSWKSIDPGPRKMHFFAKVEYTAAKVTKSIFLPFGPEKLSPWLNFFFKSTIW